MMALCWFGELIYTLNINLWGQKVAKTNSPNIESLHIWSQPENWLKSITLISMSIERMFDASVRTHWHYSNYCYSPLKGHMKGRSLFSDALQPLFPNILVQIGVSTSYKHQSQNSTHGRFQFFDWSQGQRLSAGHKAHIKQRIALSNILKDVQADPWSLVHCVLH